jgi:hypothetical protein
VVSGWRPVLSTEADGDIHIALEDAIGNRVGTVSAEIPVGPKWCEIRQTVFGWTMQGFPFSLKTPKKLKIREQHVITVTGKHSMMSLMRLRIIQINELHQRNTQCGKFIP